MKCKQVQDMMGAYLYGDLAADEMKSLRVHVRECQECREDLASRGQVVSGLDTTAPELGDEDRLRIAWSVKGAIRAGERSRAGVGLRPAGAFVLAVALLAGLGVGTLIGTRMAGPKAQVKQTQTQLERPTGRSVVTITPLEQAPRQAAGSRAPQAPAGQKSQPQTTAVKIENIVRRSGLAAITNRKHTNRQRGHVIVPEGPVRVVPDDKTPQSKEEPPDAKLPVPESSDSTETAKPGNE